MTKKLTYKQAALLAEMYKIGSVTVTYHPITEVRRAEWTEAKSRGWVGYDAVVPVRTLDSLHRHGLVSETSEMIKWRRTYWYKINSEGCKYLGVPEKGGDATAGVS